MHVYLHFIAVEAVQTVVGAEPHLAVDVLRDAEHRGLAEPFLHPDMGEDGVQHGQDAGKEQGREHGGNACRKERVRRGFRGGRPQR